MTFTDSWDPDTNKPYGQLSTPTLMARRNVAKAYAGNDLGYASRLIQIDTELLKRAVSGDQEVLDDIRTFLNR